MPDLAHLQDLTGVYIARGAHEFYLLSLSINNTPFSPPNSTSLHLRNVPTPFSSEGDDIPSETCVEIDINVPSNNRESPTGELSSLEHNESCGLGKQMATGERGTVDLAMTALAFATKVLGVTKFRFTDASVIECDDQMISLRNYSLLAKGKTWYQRHFPNVTACTHYNRLKLEADEAKLVAENVTADNTENIYKALDITGLSEDIKNQCFQTLFFSVSRGETWRQMLAACPCSFFVDSVVSVIQQTLRLGDIFLFSLHLENAHVDQHLKKYQQVYH